LCRPAGAALKTIWNLSLTGFGVLAPGASHDEQSEQDALAQRLTKYKLQKRVIFVADLPRNAMGKVQKNLLRETFWDLFARAGNWGAAYRKCSAAMPHARTRRQWERCVL